MSRISMKISIPETISQICNGNIGAFKVIQNLREKVGDRITTFLLIIDAMKLYEHNLYMLWNDCCNRDILKVIKILELYAKEIITQKDIDERVKNVEYGISFDDLIIKNESEEK